MGWVIAIGGEKGGSGKSTVAQGLAIEAVRQGALTILADMDQSQQTSLRWAERRRNAGIEPAIDARLLRAVVGATPLRRLCDLLVVDTPSRTDVTTLALAKASDLLVVTTDTNVFELEPTVMLMHALRASGLEATRSVIALNKVLDPKREEDARAYLALAGYQALPVSLPFHRLTHDIGNEGRAVTEAGSRSVSDQAKRFVAEIVGVLDRSREPIEAAKTQGRKGREQDQGDRER